jgi:hypothetical protein
MAPVHTELAALVNNAFATHFFFIVRRDHPAKRSISGTVSARAAFDTGMPAVTAVTNAWIVALCSLQECNVDKRKRAICRPASYSLKIKNL